MTDFDETAVYIISVFVSGPKAAAVISGKHNVIMHISGKSLTPPSSEESHKTAAKISLTSNNKSFIPSPKMETLNKTVTKSGNLEKTTCVPKVEALDQRMDSDDDVQVCGVEHRNPVRKRKVIVLDTDSDD
jgi:hypothetical protein